VRLLKVEGEGHNRTIESQSYEAESATLNGSAVIAACAACSGGEKVGGLALGGNNDRSEHCGEEGRGDGAQVICPRRQIRVGRPLPQEDRPGAGSPL
jgi:hypothetical protein